MYQPNAPEPWRRWISVSREAMSVIASSQLTGSKPSGPRRSGWVTRSGSLWTSVNAIPFWQAKPDDSGCSLSGRSAMSRPSSTVAIIPHSGSQIRQNVGFWSITLRPYCNDYSSRVAYPQSVRWIVDGMNVIGSRPDGWWRDRGRAMTALADKLGQGATTEADEVTSASQG